MTPFQRFQLAAIVMLFAFLSLVIPATAFDAKGYSAQEGEVLIQDEDAAPILCFTVDKAVEKIQAFDPGVEIFIYAAPSDSSRALVAYYSNGRGAFMVLEESGLVCGAMPMTLMHAYSVKRASEAETSGIVITKWPKSSPPQSQ